MGNPAANPAFLLTRDDVRADLQVTDDQKSKLFDLQQGLRQRFTEAFRQANGDEKARSLAIANILTKVSEDANAILTPGQQKRLKEIAIQLSGFASAAVADVQKTLAISDAQKSKIADLMSRQDVATRSAWQKLRDGEIQYADVQDTIKKNQKVLNDEIGKILTQPQKDKLKTLEGKKFVPTPDPSSTEPI